MRANVHATDGVRSTREGFGVGFVGPGEATWGSGEGGYVWDCACEGLVARDVAPGFSVNKVEARLCLGTSVHIGVGKHEVKVGAHCVGEGEGCEASDVRLGAI